MDNLPNSQTSVYKDSCSGDFVHIRSPARADCNITPLRSFPTKRKVTERSAGLAIKHKKPLKRSVEQREQELLELNFGLDNNSNIDYTNDQSILHNFREVYDISVDGVGGSAAAAGIGDILGTIVSQDGVSYPVQINDVLYIPENDNILSATNFIDFTDGVDSLVQRKLHEPYIEMKDGEIVMLRKEEGGLVKLSMTVDRPQRAKVRFSSPYTGEPIDREPLTNHNLYSRVSTSNNPRCVSQNYAHAIFAHASKRKLDKIKAHRLVRGVEWDSSSEWPDCYPCALGKSRRNKATKNTQTVYERRGQLVFTDIEGPISVPAFGGFHYVVHFTDAYSRYSIPFLMKDRTEVGDKFELYLGMCKKAKVTVEEIQTDNAPEYVGDSKFQQVAEDHNIKTRATSPYCHWENGYAERVIWTMTQKAFCSLAHRDLGPMFWGYAVLYAYKINNLLPHSAFNDEDSPYRRWHDATPECKLLRAFGCDVRVNVPHDSGQFQKYALPNAWISIYIGPKKIGSSTHKIFRPAFGGAKATVEDVGEAECLFFESFDKNNFLKVFEGSDYDKYIMPAEQRKAAVYSALGIDSVGPQATKTQAEGSNANHSKEYRIAIRYDLISVYEGTH